MHRIPMLGMLILPLLLVAFAFAGIPDSGPSEESILRTQLERYPGMEAVDLYKLIMQAASGPGHLGAEHAHILHWLALEAGELAPCSPSETPMVESIGGGYGRVHIAGWLASGRSLDDLAV